MQSPNLHIPVSAAIVIPHDQQWIGHAEQAPMTPASKCGTSRHAGRHMLTQKVAVEVTCCIVIRTLRVTPAGPFH